LREGGAANKLKLRPTGKYNPKQASTKINDHINYCNYIFDPINLVIGFLGLYWVFENIWITQIF